jgi:hypothetical protein
MINVMAGYVETVLHVDVDTAETVQSTDTPEHETERDATGGCSDGSRGVENTGSYKVANILKVNNA